MAAECNSAGPSTFLSSSASPISLLFVTMRVGEDSCRNLGDLRPFAACRIFVFCRATRRRRVRNLRALARRSPPRPRSSPPPPDGNSINIYGDSSQIVPLVCLCARRPLVSLLPLLPSSSHFQLFSGTEVARLRRFKLDAE